MPPLTTIILHISFLAFLCIFLDFLPLFSEKQGEKPPGFQPLSHLWQYNTTLLLSYSKTADFSTQNPAILFPKLLFSVSVFASAIHPLLHPVLLPIKFRFSELRSQLTMDNVQWTIKEFSFGK